MADKKKVGKFLKEYFIITLGLILYCSGICVFLVPNNLVSGGVSGISAIVYYATKGHMSMGLTYLLINSVLLVLAIKILGFGFGTKTIYGIAVASLLLDVLPRFIPDAFIQEFVLQNGKLICIILGGCFSGIGIGISMSQGGSTGGTDIIALIINKFKNVSPGKVILAIDVAVIASTLIMPSYASDGSLIPFSGRIATMAYGFILITVNSYVLDLYLAGSKQSVQIFIISSKPKEVADAVAYNLNRGVSLIPAKGWYTKVDRDIVMTIARKADLNIILSAVKVIDPDAFISVASVMGVYGKGFDTIKAKMKKEISVVEEKSE